MAKVTFIVYECGSEVLVTTPTHEAEFLTEYGLARNWDEYDRTEFEGTQVRLSQRQLSVSD